MWQGLGPVINSFRKNMLGLESLTSSQGAGVLDMLKIPWTYCWSDSLLPMPKDWKEHIGRFTTFTSTDKTDISGFYFFQDAGSYTPPEDLAEFLKSGKPPVYIG
jgi:sterol 3beta-glucosyltransferase